MRQITIKLGIIFLLIAVLGINPLFSNNTENPKKISLFNGKNFEGWYTYIEGRGKDKDPKDVFTVEKGMIRISGEEWGCITTMEEYANYHLIIEYKWGEKTFGKRKQNARDGGVLVHSQGEDGAYDGKWMHSIECQVIEGGTGDVIVVGDGSEDFSITSTINASGAGGRVFEPAGGKQITLTKGRLDWHGRDPEWKDIKGYRGSKDIENSPGEWNELEIIANGTDIKIFLNNHLVNHVFNVNPGKGRIQIQSEGAEMFFRKVDLITLPADFRFSYNSDCNNIFLEDQNSPERLYPYIDEVAATGATSYFYSPNWGMPLGYPTKVGDMIGEHISEELEATIKPGSQDALINFRALVSGGHDPLKVIIDRANGHGMETFVSFRLNEVHGVEKEDQLGYDRFYRDHPEWRIGKAGDPMAQVYHDIMGPRTHPIVYGWPPGGLNFAVPEVRAYRLAQLREVCERYDIDGLELDFQRFPMYFKPGEEASGIEIMTEWMHEIQAMVEQVGKKRGRKILLVARILALPERNKAIGLDPVSWVHQGILDFVTVSHYLHNNFQLPVKEYRSLLPEDFPIYASIEVEPGMEGYRNVAYPLWQQHVNGIYLFNFFAYRGSENPPPYDSIRQVGYPVTWKDPVLIIANKHSNTLSFVNPNTLDVMETVPTSASPKGIAITMDEKTAYLAGYKEENNMISRISLNSNQNVNEISTGYYSHGYIHGTAMSPDGRYAYLVVEYLGQVIEIDTRTNKISKTMPVQGRSPRMVIVSPDGKYLITSNFLSGDVSVINRSKGCLLEKIPIGTGVDGMAIAPDRKSLWVLNQTEGTITIIDMVKMEPVETVKCTGMPTRILFTPDGTKALVTGKTKEGTLTVFDVKSKKEIERIKVGDYAMGMEISADGERAFVGCEDKEQATIAMEEKDLSGNNSKGVHIINLNTLEIESVVKTGLGPNSMMMWHPIND